MAPRLLQNVAENLYRVKAAGDRNAGTAFRLGSDIAVTCAHVLEKALTAEDGAYTLIRHQDGHVARANLAPGSALLTDQADVAFLQIEETGDSASSSLELSLYGASIGDKLYSYGFPAAMGRAGMPARCQVLGPTTEAGQTVIAISSGEVTTGFSGAPAVDEESGLVVGMVVSIATADRFGKNRDSAFLIPATTLHRLNPAAAMGIHPEISQYRTFLATLLRSETYQIPELAVDPLRRFVAPLLLEHLPSEQHGFTTAELALDEWISSYVDQSASPACVIGDAGSGKSALLRHIADHLLNLGYAGAPLPIYVDARTLWEAQGSDLSAKIVAALSTARYFGAGSAPHPDFMNRWTHLYGQRFLLLVDGCDEIADSDDRREFLDFVRNQTVAYLAEQGHALLIASRPQDGISSLKRFRKIEVGPLSEAGRASASVAVLGTGAAEFDRRLARLQARSMAESPLVLQLLLALYVHGKLSSSLTLSGVYREYLSVVTSSWTRRGLLREMGDAAPFMLDIMSVIAWEDMYRGYDEDLVTVAVEEFMGEDAGFAPARARVYARRGIEFASRYSGLIRDAQPDRLDWLHLTFRDYLAAVRLCNQERAMANSAGGVTGTIGELVAGHHRDAARESFVRFVLAMIKDRDAVAAALWPVIEHDTAGLCFCARVVSDGVPLPQPVVEEIVDRLRVGATQSYALCKSLFTHSSEDPVVSLLEIAWDETAFRALTEIIEDQLVRMPEDDQSRMNRFNDEIVKAVMLRGSSAQISRISKTLRRIQGNRQEMV